MTEELLQKSMELFDSSEKWNAFVELYYVKDEIRNRWSRKLQRKLVELTSMDELHSEWTCSIWNNWDIEWKLKNSSNKYLSFHSWVGFCCRLWIRNANEEERRKIYELFAQDSRYAKLQSNYNIVNLYQSPGEILWDAHFRFDFSPTFLGNYNKMVDLFSWHAGNNVDDVAQQIMEQVNKARTEEMTDLFRQVNELLKN